MHAEHREVSPYDAASSVMLRVGVECGGFGWREYTVEAARHDERLDDLAVFERLVVATQEIGHRLDEGRMVLDGLLARRWPPGCRPQWYHFSYNCWEERMAITASEARKHLFPLIAQVNDDRLPIEITSKHGSAVLMSKDDYDSLEETAYLLRSPANVRRLLESLDQARSGDRTVQPLDR